MFFHIIVVGSSCVVPPFCVRNFLVSMMEHPRRMCFVNAVGVLEASAGCFHYRTELILDEGG